MRWSANLAYAIGLIASDGCLSKDKRHIDFTSKDLEQVENFKNILKLKTSIKIKYRGSLPRLGYYNLQFSNVILYRFLLSIGLTLNKSKVIGELAIPDKYFGDFLRGDFDGDGCTFSYWSKQWPNSFVLYTAFASASKKHLVWMQKKIQSLFGISGFIDSGNNSTFQLKFAKKSSLALFKKKYHSPSVIHLKRKRFKIEQSLGIIQQQENARVMQR